MVNREEMKLFLLHEKQSVREFVSEYFEDSWDEGEDLLPLVLEACQRYGDKKNGMVLVRAERFGVNHESLPGVLARLENARDENTIHHLNSMIVHAPVEILTAHEAEILQCHRVHSKTKERIRRRREFSGQSADDLWAALQRFSEESKDAKHVGEIDHSYADDLIETLADRDLPNARVIFDLLVSPEVEEEWLEIFLIDLAGARKVSEAIPALVGKLRIDTDYMLERASDALARIGDPEAARQISQTFAQESWTFRLYTSDLLGEIKHPESEEAILALLPGEEDLTIRTNLCFALCKLFSERGIQTVKDEIALGYHRGLVSLEDALLDIAPVLGISLTEEDLWQAERDEKERRRAERLAELEEMSRRYGALRAQGIDPFARLGEDSEDETEESAPLLDDEDAHEEHAYRPRDPNELPFRQTAAKIGRNEPCPCGSGKKYKKCCGKKN
jgi:HEAT repeat protein